jgi:cation:H+ antiporter
VLWAAQLGIFLVATAAVFAGADWIDRGAEVLCDRYRVPDAIRGGLVLAIASSFPELAAAVGSALWHDDPELGFASVAGSAVFNITLIPAACALLARRVRVARAALYREGAYYLLSVLALGGVVVWARLADPASGGRSVIRPWMAVPPLLLYLAYVGDKVRGGRDGDREDDAEESTPFAAGRVIVGVAFVLAGVEGLLQLATWLGETLETPTFVWGATVVAAATSLPDLALSVRAARKGQGVVALSNAFGSNVFDLAVVISLTAIIAGGLLVDVLVAGALLASIVLFTPAAVLIVSRKGRLARIDAAPLGLLYAAFLAVAFLVARW